MSTREQAIDRLVFAGREMLDSAEVFLTVARSEGLTTWDQVEKWVIENEDGDPDPRFVNDLRLAWEMGL